MGMVRVELRLVASLGTLFSSTVYCPSSSVIAVPSRNHVMTGVGWPVAAQWNAAAVGLVTVIPVGVVMTTGGADIVNK